MMNEDLSGIENGRGKGAYQARVNGTNADFDSVVRIGI